MTEHWHIIGRGSIGLLWAYALGKLGHSVHQVVKSSSEPTTDIFDFTSVCGEPSQFTVASQTYAQLDSKKQPIDYLVVPLKAYDILPAIQQIKPYLHANTVVILCHNGMGTIEEVQHELGATQPLLFATTTHGAWRKGRQHLVHSGLGETKIGWVSTGSVQTYNGLKHTLNQILTPVSWHDDISKVLWQKLAINCVINPLTAIHQCQNGELAKAAFNQQITHLCEEICAVANACGLPFTVSELTDNSYRVIKGTANNFSSMNRDVAAHRLTEIDYITGFLLTQAKKAGIAVPENRAVFDAIKALERS